MDAVEVLSVLEKLNVSETASETVADNTEIIADLNATQLSQGLRSDGSETLPSYTALTIQLKGEKTGLASVTDHVTLYDTGDFYKELYAEVHGEDVEVGSKNWKSDKLQKKYSTAKGSIFGLNVDSRDELVVIMQPGWQQKIEEKTGLEFEK
jgi:hypothetical protein